MSSASRTFRLASAAAWAAAGAALFQVWGNATHGYIATNSLFYWWGFQWVNPESETEHAWLVLALSLFLVWRNLRRDADRGACPPWTVAGAALAGVALHAVGFVAEQPRISIVGLLVFAGAVLALAGGRGWARATAFPLAFMVFAIPVNALDTVGFWLQMWVVGAGAWIVHGLGIDVVHNGTQLFAPDGRYQYDVVAACSGIRSLMALTALSVFVGYLRLRPLWLRIVFPLCSLPLVYLGNLLRITAIVVAAHRGGQVWGDRVHDVMGYGVFGIVLGGVLLAAEALERLRPAWAVAESPAGGTTDAPGAGAVAPVATVLVFAAAAAAFLGHRAAHPPDARPGVTLAADGRNPAELPTFLGTEWIGRQVEPEAIERSILPPDTGFSRKLYFSLEQPGQRVLLSIVLSGRDRTSIHRPELCLVGQGWTIDRSSTHRFKYPGVPEEGFEATVLSVHRQVTTPQGRRIAPEIVVYWFVGDDLVLASQTGRVLHDAWSRVALGRAPRWAYVFLQTSAADGVDAGLARMQSVLDATLPAFQPKAVGHPD